MGVQRDQTVFAVQSAIVELLEIVESSPVPPHEVTTLKNDAEQTVLMLIAGIVLADGNYSTDEQDFLSILINTEQQPSSHRRYLNEYAARWHESKTSIPAFFRSLVKYDRINRTNQSSAALREIQLVGNNVAVLNGRWTRNGMKIVQQYIGAMNSFVEIERSALHKNSPS